MKVIFLDHFGVMCLADKHGIISNPDAAPRYNEMRIHGYFDNFDSGAVDILNSITKETGAEIVISSDWKYWCEIDKMREFYLSQGIVKIPIWYTNSIVGEHDVKILRAAEILKYLETNKEITHWVAVDDLFLKGVSNFVWISRTDEGLKQNGVKEQILKFLL